MRKSRGVAGILLALAALALFVAGPVMIYEGVHGQNQVRDQLTAQKITFPAKGDAGLPADLQSYGGQTVTTGPQAKAYADMVEEHVLRRPAARPTPRCPPRTWPAAARTPPSPPSGRPPSWASPCAAP